MLEKEHRICLNKFKCSAIYVLDLSDGVAAPFEDGSFVLFHIKDNGNYRTYVCICQHNYRTYV